MQQQSYVTLMILMPMIPAHASCGMILPKTIWCEENMVIFLIAGATLIDVPPVQPPLNVSSQSGSLDSHCKSSDCQFVRLSNCFVCCTLPGPAIPLALLPEPNQKHQPHTHALLACLLFCFAVALSSLFSCTRPSAMASLCHAEIRVWRKSV